MTMKILGFSQGIPIYTPIQDFNTINQLSKNLPNLSKSWWIEKPSKGAPVAPSKLSCSVAIVDEKNNKLWEKGLSKDALNKLKSIFISKKSVGLIPALFYPVRTDRAKTFAKDFFLPTVMNHARKVDSIALRILAIAGAAILDAITFPCRLLTAIPRAIYNDIDNNKKEHPAYLALIQLGAPKNSFAKDKLRVVTTENLFLNQHHKFNLIEVPGRKFI